MKRLALILAATAFLAAPALAQTDESGTTTNAPGGSNSGVSTGTGAPAGSVNRTGSGKSMSKSAMGKKSMTKKKSGKKAKKSKKSKMKMKKSAPAGLFCTDVTFDGFKTSTDVKARMKVRAFRERLRPGEARVAGMKPAPP